MSDICNGGQFDGYTLTTDYVRGAVRFRWAATGWETGELGYPVQDEQTMRGLYPADQVDMHWSHFESGMVFSSGSDGQLALAAQASLQQIKDAIGSALVRRMAPKVYQIGLLSLQFCTTWDNWSFSFPTVKTVIGRLVDSRIHVSGVFSDMIHDQIQDAIHDAFTPGLEHPEVHDAAALVLGTVPTGANQRGQGNLDFLDVMLMADGSLNVYVNPLPTLVGGIRRNFAQSALDGALEGF